VNTVSMLSTKKNGGEIMKKTNNREVISLGTIFYNSTWSLKEYLSGLISLTYPHELLNLVFVDSSDFGEGTWNALELFQEKYGREFYDINLIFCPRVTGMKKAWMHNIVNARNLVIDSRIPKTDLVFVDSDCVPPPNAIEKLLDMRDRLKGDIVGGITIVHGGHRINRYGKRKIIPVFSAYHKVTKRATFIPIPYAYTKNKAMALPVWLREKVIRVVAMATGLVLITNKVLEKVRFKVDYKLGEDVRFFWDASDLGFNVYCNTGLWYDHLHYKYRIKKKRLGWIIIYQGINPDRFNWELGKHERDVKHLLPID